MKIDALSSQNVLIKEPSIPEKIPFSFEEWLTKAPITHFVEVNEQLHAADNALQQLAMGHATNLHHTMLTLEQAKLSFQWLEQVRNRIMSAYQELMREQI